MPYAVLHDSSKLREFITQVCSPAVKYMLIGSSAYHRTSSSTQIAHLTYSVSDMEAGVYDSLQYAVHICAMLFPARMTTIFIQPKKLLAEPWDRQHAYSEKKCATETHMQC